MIKIKVINEGHQPLPTYSIRTDWLTGIVTIVAVALAQLFFKGRVRLFSILFEFI